MNIAVFASGSGTNFQEIINNTKLGYLKCNIKILVCDKLDAFAINRAKKENIDVFSFNPKDYENKKAYEIDILNKLKENNIELIVLAGYLRLFGKTLLDEYMGQVINIHPSLLPKHKGLSAIEKAFNAKDEEFGVTVHYVDKGMDTGSIIKQEKFKNDNYTLEEVEKRIHSIEHKLYSKVIKEIIEKEKKYEKSLNKC